MILLLCCAGALTAALGDLADTAIIALVIVVNTTIGVVQERRAERAINSLRSLTPLSVTALRDGLPVVLDSALVVPGDVLLLSSGDVIPADGLVREAHGFQVDEAAVTGESLPVDVRPGGEVTSGTVVTRGRALAEVLRTGAESGLGRIAELVGSAPLRPTPLQRRLSRLSAQLVGVVSGLVVVVLLIGVAQGRPVVDMVVVAVSLAVAAVPESLPAVVSVALALGAHRMARRNAVVRRLPAVETLGSVTVLASDKTGTLTEGKMFAEALWTPTGRFTATGTGYNPEGSLLPDADALEDDVTRLGSLRQALRDLALCNDSSLVPPSSKEPAWRATGDPIDAALLVLAAKGPSDPADDRRSWVRVAEEPFEEERRTMTTMHACDGAWLLVTKGAPESVFGRLTAQTDLDLARETASSMAREGYRVLAVADRSADQPLELHSDDLELVALVGVVDPPRKKSRTVVESCRRAGVRLILITGDHRDTARVVASRVGIDADLVADGDRPTSGPALHEATVFARTKPEDKLRILRALQDRGEVVAMTGDGVNDAPALKGADIGVAMGGTGTEVARQAADLVLADDDLQTVVSAVEEGRRIYANIRAFLRYGISGGAAEVAVMLVGPFLGLGVPLLPGQILWINLLTHGLPGVAFGGEPADPAAMRRPPVPAQESVLGRGLLRDICLLGVLIAAVALAMGLVIGSDDAERRTAVFLTLGLSQLGVALSLRSPVRPRVLHQRALEAAVLGAAALQLAAVYLSPLGGLLHTVPLSVAELGMVACAAALPGLAVKRHRRSRQVPDWADACRRHTE